MARRSVDLALPVPVLGALAEAIKLAVLDAGTEGCEHMAPVGLGRCWSCLSREVNRFLCERGFIINRASYQ